MTSGGCSSAGGVADTAHQVLPKSKIHAISDKSKECPMGDLNTQARETSLDRESRSWISLPARLTSHPALAAVWSMPPGAA
jgi:hypothetical protein